MKRLPHAVSRRYHRSMAFTLRTDEELERVLSELAAAEGLSRQEIVRRAVLERYEQSQHVTHVGASADRMLERWGDVLQRLRTV